MIRRQPRILAAAALLLLALTAGCATPTVGEDVGASVSPGSGGSPGASQQASQALPEGFSYVSDVVPDVIQEIRYFSTYNFVGERIDGYDSPVAVLSTPAAEALQQASDDLRGQGYVLKVFDAYRPQRAVDHFVRWASDPGDERMKQAFYPDVDTSRLFPDGYIAERSGHSRGSTIDLSIVDASTGREVWMGTPFDFFGPASHHGAGQAEGITPEAAANRLVLRDAMVRAGFNPYAEEWWHYTLADEPYPETYFDFPVA